MIKNWFDETYLSTVNSLKPGLESHSFFLYLMIYTEKKNPIYDTKTSSKPHTPYAIQMEVWRLKRVEVTDSWGAGFMVARRNQRGSDGLVHLLAVHFLRHRKSSLQGEDRQRDTHIHKDRLSHTFKTIFNSFCFSVFFLSRNFCYCANRLYINSILLGVSIRPVGDEAIEDQLFFAQVEWTVSLMVVSFFSVRSLGTVASIRQDPGSSWVRGRNSSFLFLGRVLYSPV